MRVSKLVLLCLTFFFTAHTDKHHWDSTKCKKKYVRPAHSWAVDGAVGLQPSPIFTVFAAKNPPLNTNSDFVDKLTAVVTIKLKLCSLLPFTFVGH